MLRVLATALVLQLVPAPKPGPPGPEGVPIPKASVLAPPQALKLNQSIDGIKCGRTEQFLFHIHAHLTLFVKGKARAVPFGIGIGPPLYGVRTAQGPFVSQGTCFAWLHTHAEDGIVHIESPVQRTYTLGEFFDVWGQPLSPTRLGPAKGPVTAFYDGKVWKGNPRSIPLKKHAQIQLDEGSPVVAPEHISSFKGL